MSDRVDTEAVRRDLKAGEHRGMGTILALCDELDRTREEHEALLAQTLVLADALDDVSAVVDRTLEAVEAMRAERRAALAESPAQAEPAGEGAPTDAPQGNTERLKRCPADCEDGWRFNTGNAADPGEWVKCKNPWHRATDTEGDE